MDSDNGISRQQDPSSHRTMVLHYTLKRSYTALHSNFLEIIMGNYVNTEMIKIDQNHMKDEKRMFKKSWILCIYRNFGDKI